MKWINVIRKLSELDPWERNPRQINTNQAERLKESFKEFGQVETIAIGPDNEVYNGHQRLNVLMEEHGGEYEIECRQSSRALTEKEREKLTIFLHKGAAGEWDWDILANEFEYDELLDWGFSEYDLGKAPDFDYEKEWQNMPEFNSEDQGSVQRIVVHFKVQKDITRFGEIIGQKLTEKTRSIWYPKRAVLPLGEIISDES